MITAVAGVLVGSATDEAALTGCTVVLLPEGTVASGEVRGGAPGTRETDLLRPGMLVHTADAFLLTGGSAFGLAAADGVVRWLEERGRGFDTGVARVPIVPSAVLFDLAVGEPARPGPDDGYAACEAAGGDIAEGNVGAGTGATVAKLRGPDLAVKGGLGSASVARDGVTVGAIVAVNAYGEILDEAGGVLAGSQPGAGAQEGELPPWPGTNTTIGVVATDAELSRERASLLALAGHDGISDAVRPAHTMWDGDTIFTAATGRAGDAPPQAVLEEMARACVAAATRRAVRAARNAGGVPSAAEAAGTSGETGE